LELAARYSIHRTTVAQHLKANGIVLRTNTRKLSDHDVPAIVARYGAGESTATIAADYDVNASTIERELNVAGHGLRSRRRRAARE
jgi:hypothetical protein